MTPAGRVGVATVAFLAVAGGTVDERIREGTRLHDAGDYAGAMAVYRAILSEEPHHPKATYELCFSWSASGHDLEGLVATAREALASDREQLPQLHAILGNALDGLGRLAEGEAAFRAGLERKPRDPMMLFNLGVNLAKQGRSDEAAKTFLDAVTEKPDYASAWNGLGSTFEKLGRPARAFAAYARFLSLESESPRSAAAAEKLWPLLFSGTKVDDNANEKGGKRSITIYVPPGPKDAAGARGEPDPKMNEGLVLGIVAANRWVEEWEGKSDAQYFVKALDSTLAIFSEQDDGKDPFWSAVLPFFAAARKAGHRDALAYDIRRSIADAASKRWIEEHTDAIQRYRKWAATWKLAGKE